jgi:putative addiction module CopG family antidote
MNVILTKELEEFVRAKVAGGGYLDASEVVRDAIRRLESLERYESEELEALVLQGLAGKSQPWSQELKALIQDRGRAHAAV